MKPLKSTEPITSILNPAFQYIPAVQTNIEATFRRIRKQMAEEAKPKQDVRAMRRVK